MSQFLFDYNYFEILTFYVIFPEQSKTFDIEKTIAKVPGWKENLLDGFISAPSYQIEQARNILKLIIMTSEETKKDKFLSIVPFITDLDSMEKDSYNVKKI